MRVRSCEAVRECLHESYELVLLGVTEAETADRHRHVLRELERRPAGSFFDSSCWAVSASDVELKHVARVVEVHELLQALDIAVVEELLLEVRPRRLGSGTLWRCHGHIARRSHLHFAEVGGRELCPTRVRVVAGTSSEEQSQPQIDKTEVKGIRSEPETVRRGLIVKSVHQILGHPEIGHAEAGE